MTYEIMKPEEWKKCIELAASAFGSYDFFSVYFPKRQRRLRFLSNMLRVEFTVNKDLVHFLTAKENGKIVAVALLRDPRYQMPSVKEYLRAGFWRNLVIGGWKNVTAWFDMDQKAGVPCQELKGDVWYLHLLAVDISHEGMGVGSRMLRECLIPYVKKHGGKAFSLYTNSEINRKFYTKNGFKEFHAQQFAYNGKSFGSWSYIMDFTEHGSCRSS